MSGYSDSQLKEECGRRVKWGAKLPLGPPTSLGAQVTIGALSPELSDGKEGNEPAALRKRGGGQAESPAEQRCMHE